MDKTIRALMRMEELRRLEDSNQKVIDIPIKPKALKDGDTLTFTIHMRSEVNDEH